MKNRTTAEEPGSESVRATRNRARPPGRARRRSRFLALGLAFFFVAGASARNADEIKELVDKIAHGEGDDSADAAEELIERLIGPVADALGSVESRPAAEQLRLRKVLSRLSAALRVRLARADLPPDERKQFDGFAQRFPDLVERLFDDDFRRRVAALKMIPLEPGTGAGVLIALKVNDVDEDVVVAALEAAAELKDPVVVRGIGRWVRGATKALRSGHYGPSPDEQEIAITVALFVSRASKVLCAAGAKESTPDIVEALRHLGPVYPRVFDVPGVALALGDLRDERAAPMLLSLLDESNVNKNRSLGARRLLTQTVGDAALLGLLKIYGLEPEPFEFLRTEEPRSFWGFLEDDAREQAHRRFSLWHKQNAGKPASERTPPASQPAEKK